MATINKNELIRNVASNTCVTIKDTEIVVNELLRSILAEMQSGNKVSISGFGSFNTATQKGRYYKDPRTHKEIYRDDKIVPKFSFSKSLKDSID